MELNTSTPSSPTRPDGVCLLSTPLNALVRASSTFPGDVGDPSSDLTYLQLLMWLMVPSVLNTSLLLRLQNNCWLCFSFHLTGYIFLSVLDSPSFSRPWHALELRAGTLLLTPHMLRSFVWSVIFTTNALICVLSWMPPWHCRLGLFTEIIMSNCHWITSWTELPPPALPLNSSSDTSTISVNVNSSHDVAQDKILGTTCNFTCTTSGPSANPAVSTFSDNQGLSTTSAVPASAHSHHPLQPGLLS